MLCSNEVLVNANRIEGEAHLLRCKRWSCETCKEYNRLRVMHAARRGQPNLFMTLTCNPARWSSPDEAARDMKRGLVQLRRRIERRWKIKNIPFIVVYEKTKKGWPHMHLLLRAPYMHWKVLRAMWQEISGAHQVDVRFIKKATQVLFYVTKYIGKDLHAFEGCKRWWRSHNYDELKEAPYRPENYGYGIERDFLDWHLLVSLTEKSGVIIRSKGRHSISWRWAPGSRSGWPWRVRNRSGGAAAPVFEG